MTHTTKQLEQMLAAATPGTWQVSGQPNKVCIDGFTRNGFAKVIATANEPSWMDHGEPSANARLIAVAPTIASELIAAHRKLEAAERMVEALRDIAHSGRLDSYGDPLVLRRHARSAVTAWETAQ